MESRPRKPPKALALPGARQVVVLDDLVAVVGDHMWAAPKGLEALTITWAEGPNAHVDCARIWEDIRKARNRSGVVAKTLGDADKALAKLVLSHRVRRGSYSVAFSKKVVLAAAGGGEVIICQQLPLRGIARELGQPGQAVHP